MNKIATLKYYFKNNCLLAIGNPYQWSKSNIFIKNNETYDIVQYKTYNKVEDQLMKLDAKEAFEIVKYFQKLSFMPLIEEGNKFVEQWDSRQRKIVVSEILYSITQTNIKSFNDGKGLFFEGNNQFAKLLIEKYAKNINKEQLFIYCVKNLKISPVYFRRYFGELPETEASVIKYHDWKIRIIDGAKITIDAIKYLLDRVETVLKSKGFEKLCYGELLFQPSLKGKALADYFTSSDDIRVLAQKKYSATMINSLIHELGHRLYFAFGIDKKYFEDNFENMLHEDRGNVFKKMLDKQFNKEETNKSEKTRFEYFPTGYSKTNPREWFAELFMLYCEDKLEEPVLSWFKDKIK